MDSEIHDAEKEMIDAWLLSLGTTTWGGKGWDVLRADERQDAVSWMSAQLESMSKFCGTWDWEGEE